MESTASTQTVSLYLFSILSSRTSDLIVSHIFRVDIESWSKYYPTPQFSYRLSWVYEHGWRTTTDRWDKRAPVGIWSELCSVAIVYSDNGERDMYNNCFLRLTIHSGGAGQNELRHTPDRDAGVAQRSRTPAVATWTVIEQSQHRKFGKKPNVSTDSTSHC